MGNIHGLALRNGHHTPLGEFVPSGKFGRMFPKLHPLKTTEAALEELGNAMFETDAEDPTGDNPTVPSGFTYLGQFIDHDITFDTTSLQEAMVDPLAIHNFRSPMLDLDNVYGAGPDAQPHLYQRADPDLFQIGRTSANTPKGDPGVKTLLPFDLPRGDNGFAIIGDPRNDENLIVAQMHLAFLRFHNKVVTALKNGTIKPEEALSKTPFEQARELVISHYQWIVLNDFLTRVLDPDQLKLVLKNHSSLYTKHEDPFIPVEFSVAAYRLGHSMVRGVYDYNRVFRPGGVTPATLQLLFRFSGRSGSGANDSVPIPSDWIIDWRRFFEIDTNVKNNASRKLDPFLAAPLKAIPNVPPPNSLAVRNLKRGFSLGLPSGQNVARFFEFKPLTPEQIATGTDGAIAQKHNFHLESPLWYYILKEAEVQGGGKRLGQVGSRINAEVFVGLLERDSSSFLARKPGWKPTLPSKQKDTFTMADLMTFAGDVNPIG